MLRPVDGTVRYDREGAVATLARAAARDAPFGDYGQERR